MLISKIPTEIIENHSEFSGCPNSCNKLLQIDLDNYEITYDIKSSCVGGGGEVGASAPPKALIC